MLEKIFVSKLSGIPEKLFKAVILFRVLAGCFADYPCFLKSSYLLTIKKTDFKEHLFVVYWSRSEWLPVFVHFDGKKIVSCNLKLTKKHLPLSLHWGSWLALNKVKLKVPLILFLFWWFQNLVRFDKRHNCVLSH